MRSFSSSIWIGMMALCVLGAAAQAPEQPPAGVDAIMAYAGTWKVHGEHFTTAYSQAGKEDRTLRNDCWKSGAYVACNQYVDGESKVLLVFTYNDTTKTYTSYPIPQNGDPVPYG